jgi:hypothetical protein
MKLNWKILKVLFAFAIIMVMLFWAVNTVRPRSFDGTGLNFSIGEGTVSVTNPSEQTALVQLVGSGSRTFRVASTIEGVSGSSIRQGSGSSSTQLFEFGLPPGSSEFTVSRGTDVNFVANTTTMLHANVNPVSDGTFKAAVIATIVVVLGSLYYASNATDHSWISWLRSQFASIEDISKDDTAPHQPVSIAGGQGRARESYGDNRARTGD